MTLWRWSACAFPCWWENTCREWVMLHPPGCRGACHPALRISDAICPMTWSLLTGRTWEGSDTLIDQAEPYSNGKCWSQGWTTGLRRSCSQFLAGWGWGVTARKLMLFSEIICVAGREGTFGFAPLYLSKPWAWHDVVWCFEMLHSALHRYHHLHGTASSVPDGWEQSSTAMGAMGCSLVASITTPCDAQVYTFPLPPSHAKDNQALLWSFPHWVMQCFGFANHRERYGPWFSAGRGDFMMATPPQATG